MSSQQSSCVQVQSVNQFGNMVQQPNSFCLKWLYGTMVSKCYGCDKGIQNPPVDLDESLVVVYRDKRWYYNHKRELTLTPKEENIHFHLRRNCIHMRYPMFKPETLVVPPEFYQHLTIKHKSDLCNEFGISL